MEDCVPDIIVPGGDILEGVAKLSELEERDEEFVLTSSIFYFHLVQAFVFSSFFLS